jgi:transposase InsO family protein
MVHDPLRIACWRFQQISLFLDRSLTGSERHRLMVSMSRTEVVWPTGRMGLISLKSLYRWLRAYQKNPCIESLMPGVRKPSLLGSVIPPEWVLYALALLEEEPERSLYILIYRIRLQFQVEKSISRSSLNRALRKEPRYWMLRKRAKGQTKIRSRFQAARVHQIWYGDGKGKFKVRFMDGCQKKIQVLTLLDDCSRYVLRALIVKSESNQTAIQTFQEASARYGLPDSFYADHATAYDSDVFRKGLAMLGVHRIQSKPRDPEVRGKIEAYHKTLERWFVIELKHQLIRDEEHLQLLLDAVISELYQPHIHKELKKSPKEAFGNTLSKRQISFEQLKEAFLIRKSYTVDPKTHTIRVNGTLFRLPPNFTYQKRVTIVWDPVYPQEPFWINEKKEKILLKKAIRIQEPSQNKPTSQSQKQEDPQGSLSPILQQYQGRSLPQARSGFGLPEIYQIFSKTLGRSVPQSSQEVSLILNWLKEKGPFEPQLFQKTLEDVLSIIGPGRPLTQLLTELNKKIIPPPKKEK